MNLIRQGDVLLQKVKEMPQGAQKKARDAGRVILAYGEVTGHAHALLDTPQEAIGDLFETRDGQSFLRMEAMGKLVHEEHAAAVLAPGIYKVIQQREWGLNDVRQVAD